MSEKYIPHKYDKQELHDFQLFNKLNGSFEERFENPTHTQEGCFYDVWATYQGKGYMIELKERKLNTDIKYPNCLIEVKKYNNLMYAYRNWDTHPIPVYINFIGDNTVYIWDLSKELEMHSYHNMNIRGHEEPQERYGLYWKDATKYILGKEGKYIEDIGQQ